MAIRYFEKEEELTPLNPVQMNIAREALESDGRLTAVLNQLGVKTEEDALFLIARKLGVPMADLAKSEVPDEVLDGFPVKAVHQYGIFPIGRGEDGSLLIATCNPFRPEPIDALAAALHQPTLPVVVLPGELAKLIKNRLGVGAETVDGARQAAVCAQLMDRAWRRPTTRTGFRFWKTLTSISLPKRRWLRKRRSCVWSTKF